MYRLDFIFYITTMIIQSLPLFIETKYELDERQRVHVPKAIYTISTTPPILQLAV
jgi:hypothetical protein